ncbi:hypothetical protein [Paenibacillus eucommiae]|uniref:DUF4214 domain-containing protein n=1 Tax=Paenibacillus eucommiae TaxID=1355755 RepID=A0ABS4J3E1_9BACL|nr:hypothetical protein [Paenibacillus eucommiae]MBP1993626.1 hypothetical protein [Paenibacillus eucommiae]
MIVHHSRVRIWACFLSFVLVWGLVVSAAPTISYAADPMVVNLHNADSSSGWSGVTLDTSDKKEGSASLSGDSNPGISIPGYPSAVHMQGTMAPVHTGVTLQNGQLKLWLYVADVTKLGGGVGAIELSSNDQTTDVDELEWYVSNLSLVDGWQELTLNFSDAYVSGNPDLSAITRVRIYAFTTAATTMKVDDIRVTSIPASVPSVVLHNADTSSGWYGAGLDTSDKKEGSASLSGVSDTNYSIPGYPSAVIMQGIFAPVNTGVTLQNGQLKLWLYISDVDKLGGRVGAIELSSNDQTTDVDEIEWQWPNIKLVDGWQELTLKFSTAYVYGTPDLSAIKRVRIYAFTTGAMTMKVDHIRVTPIGGISPGAGGTAEYTGTELEVSLDDDKYGGPQFIGKLFTEGLGRLPQAEEYTHYISIIEDEGCTIGTLADIAEEFFGDTAFTGLSLTDEERALAVYRAILNRDPSLTEVSDFITRLNNMESAASIAESLTAHTEFAALMPDIVIGPYYWGVNNEDFSPSNTIMTASDVQDLLDGNDTVIELPRGALVLVDETIDIPAGKTLRTVGEPSHYASKARLLRVANVNTPVVTIQEGGTLSHIWVDGNRTAFLNDVGGLQYGINVVTRGDDVNVVSNRINDATAATNLFGSDLLRGAYFARNLVTCYATSHYLGVHGGWADAITHASTDSIIEENEVVDATDVGIILFRFASNNNDVPQTTIIRNNTVVNLGNSAYIGYVNDSWHSQGDRILDFEGSVFMNNAIWTSMRAFVQVTLSFAPLASTGSLGNTGKGGSMINNYTPEGLYVMTAAGIVADGMEDITMRGNNLNLYIGPWVGSANLTPRLISVNESTASGEVQGPYADLPMWTRNSSFLLVTSGPQYQSVVLKEARIRDATYSP